MKLARFPRAALRAAFATPLLLPLLALGQDQPDGAKPVAAPPSQVASERPTREARPQPDKIVVKSDAAFERYVDMRLLAEATKSLDPAKLADVALQFAEGERVLLRSHHSISTDEMLGFALRIAEQKRDENTIARLGRIVTQRGSEALTAQWKAAQLLSAESRSESSDNVVSVLKTTPREFAEYQKIVRYIEDRKLRGNRKALEAFQARRPGWSTLSEANRQAVVARLSDAISKIPDSQAGVNEKLLLLSAKSRDDDYGDDDYGGDDYGDDDYGDAPDDAGDDGTFQDDDYGDDDPGMEGPDLDDPDLDDPDLDDPDLNDPELNDPEMNDPEMNDPEMNDPEVNDPDLDDPDLDDPEMNDPEMHDRDQDKPRRSGKTPPLRIGNPRVSTNRRDVGGIRQPPSARPTMTVVRQEPLKQAPTKLGFRPIRVDLLSRYAEARVPREFANPSREYLLANTTTITNASTELLVVFQEDGSSNREVMGILEPGASFDLVGFVGKSLSFATVTADHQVKGIRRLTLIAGGMRLASANALSGGSRQLTNAEQDRLAWKEFDLEMAQNFGELYPGEIQDLQREINRIKTTGALRAIRNAFFILAQVPGGRLGLNLAVLPPPLPPTLIVTLGNWRNTWVEMLPRPGFQHGGAPIAGNGSNGAAPRAPRAQVPPTNSRPSNPGAGTGAAPPASMAGTYVQYLAPDKSVRRVYIFSQNNKDFSYYREVKHDDVWFAEKDTIGVYRYAKGTLQLTIPSRPTISFGVAATGTGRTLTLTDSKSTKLQWDRVK